MKSEEAVLSRPTATPIETVPRIYTVVSNRVFLLLSITTLALIVRLYGISLYPFEGDEYNSIAEALDFNRNWNSFVYSSITHFWIGFGRSELWLRLPAVIFGVAAVVVLFRIGERLGGPRCAIACGLLAAVAPYSVYHSQEMRFYSLLIFVSSIFLLANISQIESAKSLRGYLKIAAAGVVLLFSHFLGILVICAQAIANAFAHPRVPRWVRVSMLSAFVLLILLPLVPFVQRQLWAFYAAHGSVTDWSLPVTRVALPISIAKLAFTFYAFVFGYHVYPLKLWLVVPGGLLFAFLALAGAVKLWKTPWRVLPLTYLLAMVAVFFVLNSVGGSVSSVIGPRHVAFAFPVFLAVVALGMTALPVKAFKPVLAFAVLVCALSLAMGWQKDWSSGSTPDYREAAAFADKWNTANTAFVGTGRSESPFDSYFSTSLKRGDWYEYLRTNSISPLLANERIIVVSNEWMDDRRHAIEKFLRRLENDYTCVDGRVDYPLFEYVFDRKSATNLAPPAVEEVTPPFSIYGLEFQDLKLPKSITGKGVTVKVVGAAQLPNSTGEATVAFPAPQTAGKSRIVLFTNATFEREPAQGTTIAELTVKTKTGVVTRPLRLGSETAAWDQKCGAGAPCETVFNWQKRMAIAGRNGYRGVWRDFQAGIHAIAFDLEPQTQIEEISVRYVGESGHLYIWAIALV